MHIDWRGQAKIQNLTDHVGWQKSEGRARKLFWERQTKLLNVFVGGMVIGGQGHENVGVRRSNRCRVTVGKIDAAVRQANVVNDVVDFACRNLLSNRLFDLITKIGCFFNAHSGGSTQMKLKSAAVHAGEEVLAQPGKENYERAQAASEERN